MDIMRAIRDEEERDLFFIQEGMNKMNTGNTGQRYHLRKLVAIEAQGEKVMQTLECGHRVEATWDSAEQASRVAERGQSRIGAKQRCLHCPKE